MVEDSTHSAGTTDGHPFGTIKQIRKRDGRLVTFDQNKITAALSRAVTQTIGKDPALAQRLSGQVVKILEEKFDGRTIPTVEEAQDTVEKVLLENGQAKTAKSYILYRQKRAEVRRETAHTRERRD